MHLPDRGQIMQGNIVSVDVDAIVNAANSELLKGAGVCGAIFAAAGPELESACDAIGGKSNRAAVSHLDQRRIGLDPAGSGLQLPAILEMDEDGLGGCCGCQGEAAKQGCGAGAHPPTGCQSAVAAQFQDVHTPGDTGPRPAAAPWLWARPSGRCLILRWHGGYVKETGRIPSRSPRGRTAGRKACRAGI